jgi:hypothetical protein
MAWSIAQSGNANEARALDQRFQLLERRLRLVEQKAVLPANVASDFVAHEGETIFVAAPTTGLAGLLPAPKPANRGARVTLVCQTTGSVTLRAVSGTVNGQSALTRQKVGTYSLVCDGASGWWVESLDLGRPRDLVLQDWFVGGNTTSGSIGGLGWNLLGAGTPAVTRTSQSLGSGGKLQLATTAAANDRTTVCLGETEARTLTKCSEVNLCQAIWNFGAVTTLKRVFFGFATNFATAPAAAANSLGIYYDSAINGNYQIIARVGSAGSPIDSGVTATDATDHLLTIRQAAPNTFTLYKGSTLLGTYSGSAAVSALPMNVGFRLETLTTAIKSHQVGYFGLHCLGVTGVFDDDEFLKA